MEDNWITPKELRGIADYCDSLSSLWDALTNGPKGGVSVDSETTPRLKVHDSNGEQLGIITWGDSGAAFYPGTDND